MGRVSMDTMEDMATDTMERGKQSLAMVLHLSMCLRLTMVTVTILPTTLMVTILDMVMAMESVKLSLVMATDMVTMAKGRLNLVMELLLTIHMVEAAQSTELPKARLAMVSTIMARDLLMLDTMAMDIMVMVVAASSMLTGPTLPMELMLLTPTKREIVHM